ncbi:hypothetical protein [Gluconacetobacter diazotrophicus]|uniref:hypothetical protein n=1 Tax=Gluconacetobacter diazotrophicus TaxID=33996 RepID=UPI001FCBDB2B|nr:hypothetical protein [Gluconacetobacter diazotrophicus]
MVRITRTIQVQHQVQRVQGLQPGRGGEAARSLIGRQMQSQAPGHDVGAQGQRPVAVQALQAQVDPRVGQCRDADPVQHRGDMGQTRLAIQGEVRRHPGDIGPDLDPGDVDGADIDAEIQPALAAGRGRGRCGGRGLQPGNGQAVHRDPVDARAPGQQIGRPPVQHQPVDGKPRPVAVVQGDMADPERIGKPARHPLERHGAAGQRRGLPFDGMAAPAGIGGDQDAQRGDQDQAQRHAHHHAGGPCGDPAPAAPRHAGGWRGRSGTVGRHQKVSPRPI